MSLYSKPIFYISLEAVPNTVIMLNKATDRL